MEDEHIWAYTPQSRRWEWLRIIANYSESFTTYQPVGMFLFVNSATRIIQKDRKPATKILKRIKKLYS